MELVSSWERTGIEKGIQQGIHKGKEDLLTIQLEQRLSTLPENITARLDQLTSEQLDDLGKVLFGFASLADLEQWLSQR